MLGNERAAPVTLPIVLPIVKALGFDDIWFGIFLVLAVEMAQIALISIEGPSLHQADSCFSRMWIVLSVSSRRSARRLQPGFRTDPARSRSRQAVMDRGRQFE